MAGETVSQGSLTVNLWRAALYEGGSGYRALPLTQPERAQGAFYHLILAGPRKQKDSHRQPSRESLSRLKTESLRGHGTMALIPPGEKLFDLRRDFVSLCREVSVVDETHQWISLDRLWWEVDVRTRFSRLVVDYLGLLVKNHSPEQTIIVSPDTVSSSFGITPMVFIAAQEMGYPAAVWQEVGDFAANKPIMMGTRRPHLKCLVLQDTIRYGTTILKMLGSLTERRWDLITYACFALNCPKPARLERTQHEYQERTGRELRIEFLVTADTLK